MKKILILTAGVLPVIEHKGGAVESLIKSYLDFNEKEKKINFTIYSIIGDSNNNYKYTNMKFVNNCTLKYKISRAFRYIINNKLPYFYIGNAYLNNVIKQIKKNKEQYDIILIENCPLYILKLKKIFPKSKFILHIHNDFLNNTTKQSKKILSLYDLIVSVSNYIKGRIETIDKTNKIEIVYNGVNVKSFYNVVSTKDVKSYKEKLNLQNGKKIVIFVGRLIKEKGIEELIVACKKLFHEGYNFYLLIVGSKASSISKKDVFINKIVSLTKKESNIIFSGFVPYRDVPFLLNLSDIQVVPSNCGEALGNVVIEGVASGIRQIVTNDGGITEAIGKNSIVISKDKIIDNLYNALKKELSKKEIQKVYDKKFSDSFSEENYSNQILKILERENYEN